MKKFENHKTALKVASRQTCIVQHIIYALIWFGLLLNDKQKNNDNI